jgi:phosphoribosylglycinamide formyltransferase-1
MDKKELNIGFMVSHGGSNMQAVLDAISEEKLFAKPCVLISNNSKSLAIEKAKQFGMQYYHLSQKTHPNINELEQNILSTLKKHSVEYLLLLGYMKKLGKKILQEYRGKILNIHPALLPKYGGIGMYGKYIHEAVLKNKDNITGVTIHLVDEEYDTGKIINQCNVDVLENHNLESLNQRVLLKEHEFLVETLVKISNNEIIL